MPLLTRTCLQPSGSSDFNPGLARPSDPPEALRREESRAVPWAVPLDRGRPLGRRVSVLTAGPEGPARTRGSALGSALPGARCTQIQRANYRLHFVFENQSEAFIQPAISVVCCRCYCRRT